MRTELTLPLWARPNLLAITLGRLNISEPEARLIDPTFDPVKGLMKGLYRPQYTTLNLRDILRDIVATAPVDGVEIVSWMHVAAAENSLLSAREQEYDRAGSEMVSNSGDPYIPGVRADNFMFLPDRGKDVDLSGFGRVRTPSGDFSVPSLGSAVGVFRDMIGWGSISLIQRIQWLGSLIKWLKLADTPIRDAIGFFMDYIGNVAPNFFNQLPSRPAMTVNVRQRFSSSAEQVLNMRFRDPSNYALVLGSRSVPVGAGQYEVSYSLSSFPFVPPVVAEIQPSNNIETRLDLYEVY